MRDKVVLFWFRRDLRLHDNAGLHFALESGLPVLPIFIFDQDILKQFEDKSDRRVDYIHQALKSINSELADYGSSMNTYYSTPMAVFEQLNKEFDIQAVYCNRDYEPKTIARDKDIFYFFENQNIRFKALKDQVIFDKNEVVKSDGKPYTVFTPYARKWKETLQLAHYQPYSIAVDNFYKQTYTEILSLEDIGFEKTDLDFFKPTLDLEIINDYDKYRDYPAMQKTTQLGIALRFGTISIRECVALAVTLNDVWLSELIWREFFMQILYHFPYVENRSFKAKFDSIRWRNDEHEFESWCKGETGYPIVDAGMRQLNQTGFMHNRVRMIVASFLCKHLLIDWRWGESYFAQKLNDYDLSANIGNWQWAAGCGCDSAPYFRVFSPALQTDKFDKKLEYVKCWVKDFGFDEYPVAIVDHAFARERALRTYAEAVK